MADEKQFRCRLLTGQEIVLETEAASVVFPAADGQIGVLTRRAPLMAALGRGVIEIRSPQQQHRYALAGGVAHMADNVLTLIAERCVSLGQ